MKQPNLIAVSYGEPDIDSLESVFYTTLYKRMSEIKQGKVADKDMSCRTDNVNEAVCPVKGKASVNQEQKA